MQYKRFYLWFVYLAVPFSGAAIDIYTPSLPAMVGALQTTQTMIQLTITLYILGFGLGQPIIGALTDHYGRYKFLLLGVVAQVVVCLLIVLNTNSIMLLLLRFLQGLAVAFISVPARAILSDLYSGLEFKKKITNMTLAWSTSPIIAPWIGGHLQHMLGWQANFWFLLVYAAVLLFMLCFIIRETHKPVPNLTLPQVVKGYSVILTTRVFVCGLIAVGMLGSFVLIFNIIAPFLVQHQLHYSAVAYGRIALCLGVSGLVGNLTSRAMLHKKFRYAAYAFILLALISCALLIYFGWKGWLSLPVLILPSMLLVYSVCVLLPMQISHSLALFPKNAGMANAALFSGSWLTTSFITYLATHVHTKHILPLGLLDLAVVLATIIVFVIQRRDD